MGRAYLPNELMLADLKTGFTLQFGPMGGRYELKEVRNLALGLD